MLGANWPYHNTLIILSMIICKCQAEVGFHALPCNSNVSDSSFWNFSWCKGDTVKADTHLWHMQFISLVIYLVKGGNGYIVDFLPEWVGRCCILYVGTPSVLIGNLFRNWKSFISLSHLLYILPWDLWIQCHFFLQEHGKDMELKKPSRTPDSSFLATTGCVLPWILSVSMSHPCLLDRLVITWPVLNGHELELTMVKHTHVCVCVGGRG